MRFENIQAKAIEQKNMDVPVLVSSARSGVDSSPGAAPTRRRLKELPLPRYSGDLSEWRSFWRRFSELVDTDDYSDDEKLSYLLDCIKDPAAQALVSESIANGDDYSTVVDRLRKRMDKPREVYLRALKTFLSFGTVEYDKAGLATVATDLLKSLHTLERYGDGSMGQILTGIVELKMSNKFRQEWAIHHGKPEVIPHVSHLIQFAEGRQSILEATIAKNAASSAQPTKSAKPHHTSANRGSVMQARTFPSTCPACDEDHAIYGCSQFRSWDVERRKNLARRKKLCFNCLSAGHLTSSCASRKTCRTCNCKHHTLLHVTSQLPTTPASTVESAAEPQVSLKVGAPPGTSLLETALVRVEAGPHSTIARVLLDGGSNITLVTNRLANTLKAKKKPRPMKIEGLNSDSMSQHTVELTLSSVMERDGEELVTDCHIVDHIIDVPCKGLSAVAQMSFLKGKKMADWGRESRVDIILGIEDMSYCYHPDLCCSTDKKLEARKSIFGWVVRGIYSDSDATPQVLRVASVEEKADTIIQCLWKTEDLPAAASPLTAEETAAVDHFKETVKREADGRYVVSLPRKSPTPVLGESRQVALRRFNANKHSLECKGTWDAFKTSVQEYMDLDHAESVPPAELKTSPGKNYYLPMHGVSKESSTTTKLRVVFDASAKSSSGASLNDTLLPGPSLYPTLAAVLNRFRRHTIGMTADISKMFREVSLSSDERDHHRFLFQEEDGDIKDYRMRRLTFGVSSSPYLASQVLRRTADDHQIKYPKAARLIKDFYVDDVLTGASTVEEAVSLRTELNSLLGEARMTLRKWRSSSKQVLDTIPDELKEKDGLHINSDATLGAKALGVFWNTHNDTLHVSVPTLGPSPSPTKREIASSAAKVFDVLGWFAPAVVWVKVLLQRIWELGIDWDQPVPDNLSSSWDQWRKELPCILSKSIPRRLFCEEKEILDVQLHGFADASTTAYGGVVYLRTRYADTTISVSLLTAKTRVAPLKKLTIPKLELCGALLTTKLLKSVATDLEMEKSGLYAWTDSTIVLAWLKSTPTRLKVYVAHRVQDIIADLPASKWRHVPTTSNPADYASRGLLPKDLLTKELW